MSVVKRALVISNVGAKPGLTRSLICNRTTLASSCIPSSRSRHTYRPKCRSQFYHYAPVLRNSLPPHFFLNPYLIHLCLICPPLCSLKYPKLIYSAFFPPFFPSYSLYSPRLPVVRYIVIDLAMFLPGLPVSNIDIDIIDDTFEVSMSTILWRRSIESSIDDTFTAVFFDISILFCWLYLNFQVITSLTMT